MSKFPATSYWHPDGMRIGEGGHFVEASEYRALLRQRDALLEAAKAFVVGWDAAENDPNNFCDEQVMEDLPSIEPLRAAIAECETKEPS